MPVQYIESLTAIQYRVPRTTKSVPLYPPLSWLHMLLYLQVRSR
jgi:hypothetical protein